MTEQHFEMGNFDREPVSTTLAAEARPSRDVAHGDGEAFTIADGKTELEVYPDAAVARVTTADARVEIYRVPGYSVNPHVGLVVFEQDAHDHRTRLLVNRDGKVSFHPVLRLTHSPTPADTPADDAQLPLGVSPAPEATTGPHEPPSSPHPHAESAETEHVQLRGNLGDDPWFTSGDGSELIGGFPLAVNPPGRRPTKWYRVVTFGEAAEQLRDAHRSGRIKKGRTVDVTGQHVTREEQTDSGRKRTVREFHATNVTRVTANKPQAPRT